MEGNVRELRDAVKYMCIKAKASKEIQLIHVNSNYYYSKEQSIGDINLDVSNMKKVILDIGYDNYMSNLEKIVLTNIISDEKSIRALSKKIKVTDMTLGRRLKKYGLGSDYSK